MKLKISHKGVLLLLALLASCRGEHAKPTFEYMPDMANAPSVKAQEQPMRVPPAGTRPVGYRPYAFTQADGDLAGATLKNPLAMNVANLTRGQKGYDTYCIVCHGPGGKGNGFIVPKFPMPPTLHSEKVTTWSDGRIFHVITAGQNLMPSYATQIPEEDRWAIAMYVRALQRSVKPTQEDVDAFNAALKGGANP